MKISVLSVLIFGAGAIVSVPVRGDDFCSRMDDQRYKAAVISQKVVDQLTLKGCPVGDTEGDVTSCSKPLQAIYNEWVESPSWITVMDKEIQGDYSCLQALRGYTKALNAGRRALGQLNRLK